MGVGVRSRAAARGLKGAAWALVLAVTACGGRAERAESREEGGAGAPGSGDAGAPGSGDAGAPGSGGAGAPGSGDAGAPGSGDAGAGGAALTGDGLLVLPVVPREESELLLMLEEAEVGFDTFPGWSVDLALGDGYAPTVRFELDDGYLVREGGTYLTDLDGLTLTSATVQSGELGATLVDGESLELTAREVGDFIVTLEGDWVPATEDEPSARAFSLELGVRVRRVASVVWNACVRSPVRVIAGTPFAMAWHEVFDENGERFSPANARSSSNVEFTVRAAPGTKLTAKDGLASLVAEGPDQRIQVEAFGSSIGSFELIQLDAVDALEARFLFAADWMRGTTELFDGDTAYVPSAELGPGHIGVAPMLSVGGVKVCSPPLAEWFEVRSETPATCRETSELGCGGACPESALPVVVLAENAGTCELAVSAPATNGGSGTRAARSVELIPRGGSDDTGR